MKRLLLRFAVALLAFVAGVAVFLWWNNPRSEELSLVLTTKSGVVRVGEYPALSMYITNHSNKIATLVQPGDGSHSGIRTPVVNWSIVEVGDSGLKLPDELRIRGCGNINALRWNEVFTLAPGETREIKDWAPRFEKPGTYRVRMSYANRPSLQWKGYEMGFHNPLAMWRVRHSTECSLTSNEVLLTVVE